MATGDRKDVEAALTTCLERGVTDGKLKLSPVIRAFDTAKLTKYKRALEASVWTKHQDAGKKIAVKTVATTILDEVAACYVAMEKKLKDKPKMDEPEVQKALEEILTKLAPLKDAKKPTGPKMDAATKRLTDTSGYTGSHKERFGEDGKGKGIEGRKDVVDGSGYVGNYKGQGTYDASH